MMVEEDRIKEQKKRETVERAMVRKTRRTKKKVQEKEARKQCSVAFKSGKRKRQQCIVTCLPGSEEQFLWKCHNATSLDVVPLDVHPVNLPNASLNEQTHSDTNQDEADSVFDEQCTVSNLEVACKSSSTFTAAGHNPYISSTAFTTRIVAAIPAKSFFSTSSTASRQHPHAPGCDTLQCTSSPSIVNHS